MDADDALVAQAMKGNREAFDQLVTRHQVSMFTLARVLTGGDADAEDLVQETFVRAFRAIPRFRRESSFRTWLHRIAVNVIKSHLARRQRRPELSVRMDADETESALDQLPSDEDLETAVLRRQLIDRALSTLSDEVRLLITLRDVEGLEYHEIASVTGLPLGTVESRVFRARQRLRPMLEPLVGRRYKNRVQA